MQQKFNDIIFYAGNERTVEKMQSVPPLKPFSDEVIRFLDELSKLLMKDGKGYSDVVSFAFFCRKASTESFKRQYGDLENRLGRGLAFHIAPSNVPVNFAFSLAVGLLAGNANIVRMPSKDFEQPDIICNAINKLLTDKFDHLSDYICLVKYPREGSATQIFSSICDVRIIWGGDDTINSIRKHPLKPRANEITFADRYSICIINSDSYLKMENKAKIAQDFYNDTYFFDQNACSSPCLIVWTGSCVSEAKAVFWDAVDKLAREKYHLEPIQTADKFSAFCKFAANGHHARLIDRNNNYVMRIGLDALSPEIMAYKANSGFFFEYNAEKLSDILPVCTERCQTLTHLGMQGSELTDFINVYSPKGVDRIVPVGKAMEFSLEWDGYDLIYSLSRVIHKD